MSLDMRLLTVPEDTVGSGDTEHMAVGLSDPLGSNRATGPAKRASYVTSPSGGTSCRLQVADCSPVIVKSTAEARTQRKVMRATCPAQRSRPSFLAIWLGACPRAETKDVVVSAPTSRHGVAAPCRNQWLLLLSRTSHPHVLEDGRGKL